MFHSFSCPHPSGFPAITPARIGGPLRLYAPTGGFQPSVQGRLFQEDVPSGLCVLRGIAEMVKVPTPTIDMMIEWHQKFMKIEFLKDGRLNPETIHLTTSPQRYGINTIEQLAATTLRGCSGSAHASKI